MFFNNISFILHKPQLSENIGASARAVKNFCFKKLIVINPKPIFPNDKILATSVGAKNIIKNKRPWNYIHTLEMIQTYGVDSGLNIINENSVIWFNFVHLTVLYTNALVNDLDEHGWKR